MRTPPRAAVRPSQASSPGSATDSCRTNEIVTYSLFKQIKQSHNRTVAQPNSQTLNPFFSSFLRVSATGFHTSDENEHHQTFTRPVRQASSHAEKQTAENSQTVKQSKSSQNVISKLLHQALTPTLIMMNGRRHQTDKHSNSNSQTDKQVNSQPLNPYFSTFFTRLCHRLSS